MRVLVATTANEGHFGPLVPFARACAAAGHEVRVAAPASFDHAVARAGFVHEPFADAPPELAGPIMASLPHLSLDEADDIVIRDVFGRMDAQAGLPAVVELVDRWRPDIVLRESAELASVAAAERAGVPHVHVCIGMHEVITRFANAIIDPLVELGRLADVDEGQLAAAVAAETVLSSVPELLDHAAGDVPPEASRVRRFHEPKAAAGSNGLPTWGDPEVPLVYVTFGSVLGALPHFSGVFREALDSLAELDVRVLMTVGRKVDPATLGPLPRNAHVEQWCPQDAVLSQASAMLGHGGFGTTMGALAAGVPQVVVPIFTFDQAVNSIHVAAVGAGLAVERGSVATAAAEVSRLLEDPTYAESARRISAAMGALPPPAEAVPLLVGLAG